MNKVMEIVFSILATAFDMVITMMFFKSCMKKRNSLISNFLFCSIFVGAFAVDMVLSQFGAAGMFYAIKSLIIYMLLSLMYDTKWLTRIFTAVSFLVFQMLSEVISYFIETFHDIENNRVYTHVDELGTYCLMDMEIWLKSLGIEPDSIVGNEVSLLSLTDECEETISANYLNSSSTEKIDIVFLLYVLPSYTYDIKAELINAVNEIYNRASDIRIHFLVNDGRSVVPYQIGDREYTETKEEAISLINRFNFKNETTGTLYRGLSEVNNISFRSDAQKHLFLIDAVLYPPTGTSYEILDKLKDSGVTFGIICDKDNNNLSQYTSLASGNLKNNPIVFLDFIINQIRFPENAEKKLIITSSGLTPLPDDFGDLSRTSIRDYDNDTLKDVEEIDFEYVSFNDDGTIIYPSFPEMQKIYKGIFYVEKGLKRLEEDIDTNEHNPFRNIYVLPIKSDPTNPDGDGDKVVDSVDLRPLTYIPNFEELDLDSETISWYYDIRIDIIPDIDEHGNEITANNRENTVTEYYFNEYVAPRYHDKTYHEWAQSTYGISDREIYFQKSYEQITLGNAYEGEATILGIGGSIIVGFTPFGIVCDIRDLTIDLAQFDCDKGLKQGKDWYLQAIPDFISVIPIAGDICKGTDDVLSSLSKTDASKIVNTVLESATDAQGKVVKSADEVSRIISDEAAAIAKQVDYNNIDEIIDVADDAASEASAKIANEAIKQSELIGDSGRFIDDVLEADYQKYVNKKKDLGKPYRKRLDWKERVDNFLGNKMIKRGNDFNHKAVTEKWYPYNEVVLENKKRLDSYVPPSLSDTGRGKIISRKATDLEDIQEATFRKYLAEFESKYSRGTKINSPKYGDELKGEILQGDYYLEIPSSNMYFADIEHYKDIAREYGVEIIFRNE